MLNGNLTIIGTCPTYPRVSGRNFTPGEDYRKRVVAAAQRAERQGWSAILVYSDNNQFDPWLLAAMILEATNKISPLVAVQPIYMHPFAVAKAVASLSTIYQRPVHLNLIAGGFPRDLECLGDKTEHDRRYYRLSEFGLIVRDLLSARRPVTVNGEFYQVKGAQLFPPLPPHLFPMFTMAGSSHAGKNVAHQLGARSVQYLRPFAEYEEDEFAAVPEPGARVGIIARQSSNDAWAAARARYPENSDGAALREYAAHISDSVWVKELGREVKIPSGHPYWLGPYKNGHEACPFLVGSEDAVAAELAGYIRLGLRTFLVAEPASDEDAKFISSSFKLAKAKDDTAKSDLIYAL